MSMQLRSRTNRTKPTVSEGAMDASSLDGASVNVESSKAFELDASMLSYHRDEQRLGGSATSRDSNSSNEGYEIAQAETKTVNMLRALLIAIIVLAAVTVSSIIYVFLRDEEEEKFVTAFLTHSSKITESVNLNVKAQLATLETFAITLTSFAQSHNATWPFVTLPSYERHAHSILSQLKSLSLLTVPLVTSENRALWEDYAVENFGSWSQESLDYQRLGADDNMFHRNLLEQELETSAITTATATLDYSTGISEAIHTRNSMGVRIPDPTEGPYFPVWQNAPFVSKQIENNNLGLLDRYKVGIDVAFNEGKASMGSTANFGFAPDPRTEPVLVTVASLLSVWGYNDQSGGKDPFGFLFYPIRDTAGQAKEVVGAMIMYLHWRSLFLNILPPSAKDVDVVFESSCRVDPDGGDATTEMFTYRIRGSDAVFVSSSDKHNDKYDYLEQSVSIVASFNDKLASGDHYDGAPLSEKNCLYTLRVYPTDILHEQYTTNAPVYYALVVVGVFLFAGLVFAVYDVTVELRQRKVMRNALTTNAIVNSLFPSEIANRMIAEAESEAEEEACQKQKRRGSFHFTSYMSNRQKLKSMLDGSTWSLGSGAGGGRRRAQETPKAQKQHMAELFPSTTVMVADICGFSSWSSAREPIQVFSCLETIFFAFDKLATKQKVFKVETNADSYTAVTGLPDKQPDHAHRMAKFALECMHTMNELIVDMEAQFGPDTGELKLRIGMNSGPVTAGVMKGQRSRFQVFGEVATTAASLESTSKPNHIQLSKTTAQLLEETGHGDMVVRREDAVPIKGKGPVETYFLVTPRQQRLVAMHANNQSLSLLSETAMKKKERLIQWNVKILKGHLQKVVARRQAVKGSTRTSYDVDELKCESSGHCCVSSQHEKTTCLPLEEIEDIISMPPFDPQIMNKEPNASSVNLGFNVELQLQVFVRGIAQQYHNNPFHNFEHASCVAMSVDKLLSRIVHPDIEMDTEQALSEKFGRKSVAQEFHHFSHGITSDPLTHFAVVLSALIHDVDHRGVGNGQLAEEDPAMAEHYKNKSIAEQNSFDRAWKLLMQDDLKDLRACIFSDHDELHRFRQTVIKTVLATDIFDKELNDLRKKRWAMAFADGKDDVQPEMAKQEVNVKATIVIEHLIQASDVSHTMQHWHIYRKWNERLFMEMYEAFLANRMGKDPSTFWYQGELGFFDNYILPLAQKLKECQVFGVSSAEFLSYAMANREEWQQKGEQLVAEMVKSCKEALERSERDKEQCETLLCDDEENDSDSGWRDPEHSITEASLDLEEERQLDQSSASTQGVRRLEEGLSELEAELEALTERRTIIDT